ncbi:MAG: DUF4040 domain-containing protein [Clostridiales bacterium]|nr:DUF4040 domain-containing protein [Oscillospiraceae bacterium]MDD5906081.1 DUF4040 domain-containing protein [Clostridiales bacterium]
MTTLYTILNSLCLLGIVVSAILAVTLEKPLSASIALGATGAFVSLEFLLLQAPDVAIAEASVGAVLSTVLFVVAVKKTTKKGDEEK